MDEGGSEDEDHFEIVEEIVFDDENEEQQEAQALAHDMEDMAVGNDDIVESDDIGENPEEERDDSAITFTGHTAPVFCVNLDPVNCTTCVSGGEDDKAFVWKVSDGKTLFICEGHRDSVIAASFSHDSKYVATGDMSGVIKVWDVDTGKETWSYETSDLEWLQWHHSTNVLFAGTSDGEFWMWKIPSSGVCKTYQGHGVKNTCAVLLKDGKRLFTGYGDGSLKLWDLKAGNDLFQVTGGFGHSQSVTCVDVNAENTIAASGSEDSTVKLINIGNGKVVGTINAGLKQEKDNEDISIEVVKFFSSQPLLATASLSGTVGVWDVASQKLRHECRHPASVTQLRWDETSALIYTACLDGVLRLWDARSGNCEREWFGHTAAILDVVVSKDSSIIVSSSDDGTVKTFSIIQPGR